MPQAKLFSTPSHICFPFFLSLIWAMASNASLSQTAVTKVQCLSLLQSSHSLPVLPAIIFLQVWSCCLTPSAPGRKHRRGSFGDVEFSWFCRSRSEDLCCGAGGLGWNSGCQECNCLFVGLLHLTVKVKQWGLVGHRSGSAKHRFGREKKKNPPQNTFLQCAKG